MVIVEGDRCPMCQGTNFAESFKGKVIMLKPEQSEIAGKLGIKQKGSYAIKI